MADSSWYKALRGTPQTPRSKLLNNRYGSRGAPDPEEVESESSCSSSASTQRRTPRHAGVYDRPWKDLGSITTVGRGTPRSKSGLAVQRPPVPRQNSTATEDADSASVAESDDVSVMTEEDFGGQEGDSVQVFVRVRPVNAAEAAEAEQYSCTRIFGDRTLSVELKHRSEPYQFKFDCVMPETTSQQEIFERAGKPIVDNCMGGYNSSIFAYGQTGAGKTYTMQGPLVAALQDGNEQRGLAPRVFEYLFTEIDKAQDDNCHENLTFCCRCSMLEIYNEVITDLLNPGATNLQIREDIKRGCYVEDLSEHLIQNVSDAMRLMRLGAENRHVGETRLNRESSRSHSVFTCTLERQNKNQETGVTNVLFSRLNLIDLAGSERIHGGEHGGSQATGKHFKEACHINKSLTTLGRVIMELVEAQRSAGKGSGTGKGMNGNRMRHVPYRDSRLTFLLQDSLGGNAKTLMIANISPSSVSAQETLSTLHFMSRAKCIRNRAQINLDARGDVVLLQREIVRLNNELDNLRKGYTEPAIQENKELREKLEEVSGAKGQMELLMVVMEKENQNLKAERRRLDHKMAQIQKGAGQLDQAIFSLTTKVMHHEALSAAALERSLQAAEAERALQVAELKLQLEVAQNSSRGADELQHVVDDLTAQLQQAQQQAASTSSQLDDVQQEAASLHEQLQAVQQESASLAEQLKSAQQQSESLTEQLESAEQQSDELSGQLDATQQESAELSEQLQAVQQECASLTQQLTTAQQNAECLAEQLSRAQQESVSITEQLHNAQQESASLQEQLAAEHEESACLKDQLNTAQEHLAQTQEQLAVQKQESAGLLEQLDCAKQESAGLAEQVSAGQQEALKLADQLAATRKELDNARNELQQERDNAQTQLAQLTASLTTANEQVQGYQAEVQSVLAEASSLKESSQELQQQLGQQQQDNQQLQQQLAELQELAAQTRSELTRARDQASCTEQEASKQLADALSSRDALQHALEAARCTNADLDTQVQGLQALLEQHQQQLESETAARKAEAEQAAASQQAAAEVEQQLRDHLAEVQQLLAAKQEDLAAVSNEKQELQSKVGLKQQQCSELQQQLQAEQSRSAEGRAQVTALEEALSELNAAMKEKSHALEAAQDQIKQLQQQLEATSSSAAAKADQLSSDLAAARESSKSRQEELMKQVTEVHLQLSAVQQEQERLQDELDAARGDNSLLQGQLADAQGQIDKLRGQATSKGLDCELLRKKLSAADATVASLNTDLEERQQAVEELRHQLQMTEATADEEQQKAAEQLNALQRDLMDAQQLLTSRNFEAHQLQRRMEELSNRLADKSGSLEAAKEEVKGLKGTVSKLEGQARQRDALLAEKSALAGQLQADNEALHSRLRDVQDDLAIKEAQLRGKLNQNELQLKEQIVYNARNRQAMNEIRKVINWAQQPPVALTPTHSSGGGGGHFSRPGSATKHRQQQQLMLSPLDTGSIPGSPASLADVHLTADSPYEAGDLEDAGRAMMPPALTYHSSHISHQHSGGSSGSSSKHHSVHSRRHTHHHHHQQHGHADRYGDHAAMAATGGNGDLGGAPSSLGAGSSTSSSVIRHGSGSSSSAAPQQLPVADIPLLMLQESEDLGVDSVCEEPTHVAGSNRDTAGGTSPATAEDAMLARMSSGSSRSKGRGGRCESPTRRSTGSKQHMVAGATAAAAAAHHKPQPDQQHHLRQQELFAMDMEDDLLQAPRPDASFDAQEGQTYNDSRAELLASDGSARQLMAPQQASSPLPPSPKDHLHSSMSRSRAGRDAGSRRGLRAGSDHHTFGGINKRHKVLVSGDTSNVVLSVSAEWSAGGHDGSPDMRLPAAIVGDCEVEL